MEPPDWAPAEAPPPLLQNPSLLEDWLTIWHSELAAILGDRELQEANLRLLDAWAAQARALLHAARPFPDASGPAPSGTARSVPPPWPASLAAAPDARDAELARLLERIAELERKLAGG